MGFLDKAKDKLANLIDDKGEQLGDGLDKAADFVDDKTGGKFTDKIDTRVDKVKDALDGLDGDEDIPDSNRPDTTAAPAEKAESPKPETEPPPRSMPKPQSADQA